MIKRCIGDPEYIVPIKGLDVDENPSYEEVPVEILNHQVKKLRSKDVASIKVLGRNHLVEGAKWDDEVHMKSHYPTLFSNKG